MPQREYVENRTNRRVSKQPYKGKNRRKGLGRRKPERYSYYAYMVMLSTLSVIMISFMTVICFNFLQG